METCDFCFASFRYPDRRVVATPRPSDPTELVAVMWGCGDCESSAELPTHREIDEAHERGEYPGVYFLTI